MNVSSLGVFFFFFAVLRNQRLLWQVIKTESFLAYYSLYFLVLVGL